MAKYCYVIILLTLVGSCKEKEVVKKEEIKSQPNILFIAIDDLRPELGTYGSDIAITPNIDALAADGLEFNNAYCQEAICSPSRASVMTGARPETLRVIENYSYFRDLNPDIKTLPQHLRAHGYETVYTGKIFHPGYTDEELSWSRKANPNSIPSKAPNTPGGFKLVENQELFRNNSAEMAKKYGKESLKSGLGRGPAYEFVDLPDNEYEDGYNTDLAIATLKEMVKEGNKPFFLGLGFLKPHLDWVAPKKYWDLYDEKKIKLAQETSSPKDGAAMGLHASFELRARANIPNAGEINENKQPNPEFCRCGAVDRNTVRRRLREIVRKHQERLVPGWDWAVIARWRAPQLTFAELEKDWLHVARRSGILRRDTPTSSPTDSTSK